MPPNLCSSLLWALGCQIKCRNSFKKGSEDVGAPQEAETLCLLLQTQKPSEVLRGSRALTHGESRAAGDTELLAAAQLIMPSHPLKAIVPWNRNQYPTHATS